MFGSAGAGNFLTRTSAILATGFFVIALVLGNINSHRGNVQKGSFDDLSQTAEQVQQQQQQVAPAVENKNNDIPQVRNKNRINALVAELVDTLS